MPIYEYRCKKGHTFEVKQRMADDSLDTCTACDAPVQRVFHPVAVHFKGSGFYNTDYGTKSRNAEDAKAKSAKDEKKKSADEGKSKGDSDSSSKSSADSSSADSSSSDSSGGSSKSDGAKKSDAKASSGSKS